jgi:nitroreductase
VPAEIVAGIIALAGHSPTASNRQNVGYTVISDPRRLRAISQAVFGVGRWVHDRTRQGLGRWIYHLLNKVSPDNSLARYLTPMEYYIAQTEKGRDYILHGAPVLILLHGPAHGAFHAENCNIAATNIMNYAHARGLGTCYIGFLCLALKFSRRLRGLVQTPKGRQVYACLVMGYPAYRHAFTASRKPPSVQWICGHSTASPSPRGPA